MLPSKRGSVTVERFATRRLPPTRHQPTSPHPERLSLAEQRPYSVTIHDREPPLPAGVAHHENRTAAVAVGHVHVLLTKFVFEVAVIGAGLITVEGRPLARARPVAVRDLEQGRDIVFAGLGHRRPCSLCSGVQVKSSSSFARNAISVCKSSLDLLPPRAHQAGSTRQSRVYFDSLPPQEIAEANRSDSAKKVWWQCPARTDHEWRAKVSRRVAGKGCPFCTGIDYPRDKSLAANYPDLAREWHKTKNGRLKATSVPSTCDLLVYWRCAENPKHVWRTQLKNRTRRGGRGCPICAGQVATPEDSLARVNPRLARQWHPDRNGSLRPRDVLPQSGKTAWWRCSRGHEWKSRIQSRTRGNGCPMCSGKQVTPETSVKARSPKIASEWHPKKNGALTPEDVTNGSSRRVWWRCSKNRRHEWEAVISSRTGDGAGCPVCSGKVVLPETSFAALHPAIAREWHPKRNAPLRPEEVRPGSDKRVWWRCSKNKSHEWQTQVKNRSDLGTGCPMCSHRIATPETSLAGRFPQVASDWHPTRNKPLTPHDASAAP